jgi:hypothetical protein
MTCENCGLPPGATNSPGQTIQITRPAENSFKRNTKSTVWCCSEECAVQAYAMSQYGKASHKWELPLSKIRTEYRRSQWLLTS